MNQMNDATKRSILRWIHTITNAIGYAKFFSRSHDAAICV
jgi:hypothetical protein